MNCDLLLIAGTRPEALKLAPLATPLRARKAWCWSSQQPEIPYGDGHAGARAAAAIDDWLQRAGTPARACA